jgi:hypothetical protein
MPNHPIDQTSIKEISDLLYATRVRAYHLSALTNTNAGVLSRFLLGREAVRPALVSEWKRLLREILEIQQEAHEALGVAIDTRNTASLRASLEAYRLRRRAESSETDEPESDEPEPSENASNLSREQARRLSDTSLKRAVFAQTGRAGVSIK